MKRKQKAQPKRRANRKTDHPVENLDDLQHVELSGNDTKHLSLDASSTDESENEGLGDGNIGRSARDVLGK